MDTQVMNRNSNSAPQRVMSPQAQNASAPMYTPHPQTPQEYPLGRPYPDSVPPADRRLTTGPSGYQPRPEPVFNVKPQNVRSVDERHSAFLKAQEALHDRHYEDNNLRLQAEIALAEFFLA